MNQPIIVAMGRNWVQYPGYPQDKAASSQKSATGGFLGTSGYHKHLELHKQYHNEQHSND